MATQDAGYITALYDARRAVDAAAALSPSFHLRGSAMRSIRDIVADCDYDALLRAIASANPVVWIAGGACVPDSDLNDVDVFSNVAIKVPFVELHRVGAERVAATPSAETWKLGKSVVQICRYSHPTLKDLVDSFDFTHCQAGVSVEIRNGVWEEVESYETRDAVEAWEKGNTEYRGSAYPISSLVRSLKYAERGLIRGHGAKCAVAFAILADVCKRGFVDYTDFKRQLDAIDLGVLDSDWHDDLVKIYEALRK